MEEFKLKRKETNKKSYLKRKAKLAAIKQKNNDNADNADNADNEDNVEIVKQEPLTKQEKKLILNKKYQHKKKLKEIEDIRQQVKLELYDSIRAELYAEIKAKIEKELREEIYKKYIADAKMKLKKLRKHIESTNTDNNI